jgi:sarcosine oxidase subunit gamma
VDNVSDARAYITLSGADGLVREVLAKVVPVDMDPQQMPAGQMRRTKLAQVAAAIWMQGTGEARVVCFRSVGTYAFDVLCTVAAPGSAVGFFAS